MKKSLDNKKFRWGYVGSGSIALSTAKSILKGNHEITAVYGRSFDKVRSFAERFGAKAYKSYDEFLLDGEFDAVYIATPHTSHVEYAVAALKAHVPVLCEKPVGVSEADVRLLIETAKENDTYFVEAMWTWFSDLSLSVKKWVDDGKIGDIKNVEIHYAFLGLSMKADSRVRDPMTAGGALLDIGIYPITYCYNLFGYPDKIECTGTLKDGIDINERVVLSYGDLRCELYMSLEYLKESFVAKGSKGSIKMPVFHCGRVAFRQNGLKISTIFGKINYLIEFDRCAEEIRQGKKESDYIPFKATLDCMKIMDECRRQMKLIYPFEK